MTGADLDAVARIEADSYPDAWTREVLEHALGRPDTHCRVATIDRTVVAFYVSRVERGRMHLSNIAVTPSLRRRGVAEVALRDLDAVARRHHRSVIELEVREGNLAAQLLYRKAGYKAVRILRRFYGREDAYLMRKRLKAAAHR